MIQALLLVGLQQHSINLSVSFEFGADVLVPHDVANDVDRYVGRLCLLSRVARKRERTRDEGKREN